MFRNFQDYAMSVQGSAIFNFTFVSLQLWILSLNVSHFFLNPEPHGMTVSIGLGILSCCLMISFHILNLKRIIPEISKWWAFFSNKKMFVYDLLVGEDGNDPFENMQAFSNAKEFEEKIDNWLHEGEIKYVKVNEYTKKRPYNSTCYILKSKEDMVLFKLTWQGGT